MACFKRSFAIRAKRLGGENFDVIADCYYNIGLVYKQTGNHIKAIYALNQALEIRATVIGETSLPVAQCLEILGKVYAEKGDYKSAYIRFNDCLNLRKIQLDSKDPQLKRVQNLLLELRSKIAHDLAQTKQTKKTRETYEYITECLNQNLQGVKGLKLYSRNSINEMVLASKFKTNGEQQLLRESRDNLYFHRSLDMKEPVTPPSENNNESIEKYSEGGERGATFTDSVSHDESRGKITPERSSIRALLGKSAGKFGAAREKISASPDHILDAMKTKTQTKSNSFQLRVDNAIVMGMASDQLMQMVQLQSRLRTVNGVEEAHRILIGSAFYRNLSLYDKVSFRASNPEYFKSLTSKIEAIFTAFLTKIANNDPSTDFRQGIKRLTITNPTEDGLHYRSSRSNAMKPAGSKLKGTLKRDSFTGNNSLEEFSLNKPSSESLGDKDMLKQQSPMGESTETAQAKRTNQSPENESRENSQDASGDGEQLGRYKLQRQILSNSLFQEDEENAEG